MAELRALHQDDQGDSAKGGETLKVTLPPQAAGVRLDKALADAASALTGDGKLSRARIQALMAEGAVTMEGDCDAPLPAKAKGGDTYRIAVPAPAAAEPEAQAISLTVLYEDAHLIVIDKAPGMAAHPAPGTPDGTLVNALLHHCGASLSGVGGVARPGIVHRLDKDTSGVMVAAKTDAAHQGLSKLFAAHDIERTYIALVRGVPEPSRDTVATQIGRARFDRQRMAVLKSGGREAITHYAVQRIWGENTSKGLRPLAARVACTLQTGRTHQIRVHMAHKGAPVLGDAVYGSTPPGAKVRSAIEAAELVRQALHAAILGFVHPVTKEALRFETALPDDMTLLEAQLSDRLNIL